MSAIVKNHRLYSIFRGIKDRLHQHQFVCWIAGGAVRDFLLDRQVADFDLVTDATTEVLKKIFPEALLVGESFGVLKIPISAGEYMDLTSFRQESDYEDGRRPSHVSSSTPTQDSVRRDFTINALFWDDEGDRIVDYQGGRGDIELKALRCVGDANTRFSEDYLRILRLLRFEAVLGFQVEEKTYHAALRAVSGISRISGERIWAELKKIEGIKPQNGNLDKAWRNVLSQELGQEIFKSILNPCSLNMERVLTAKHRLDLMVALYLLAEQEDLSGVLKSRLKLSRDELKEYQRTTHLLGDFSKKQLEEWAYEFEKDELLFQRAKQLAEQGWIDENLILSAEKMLKNHSEPLLLAKEMLDLIPAPKIGLEQKEIRVLQMKGELKDRAAALVYLKKKYAKI
ncbi:CCA tRNA nucleotidyltransferase [Pseudobdellovibrio exovorus]|uniref:Poly A polymerase n=1 Tax=Pseudobdellovibrio exovorus JSS TaxID=1184267 RepID=M4VQ65_9BACT|nr:CCA tRNA nucleotidyltransferase [Pseudobdellovibrio exovorus]AGH95294.1 poly A polymerase [Pseudobdellovibrio exovorus JSS]